MTTLRPGKGYYNENEAAQALGISLEEFRVLVRKHILEADDDLVNLPLMSFQPSDLLLLKLLSRGAGMQEGAAAS